MRGCNWRVGGCWWGPAAVVLAAAGARGQNLVQNGSFETPAAGGSFISIGGGGTMGAWVVDGAIDLIGGFWTAESGTQSVDMNSGSAGAIHQDLATVAGRRYRVNYAYCGNPFGLGNKTFEVRWNDALVRSVEFVQNGQTATAMGWVHGSVSVLASGTTSRLSFVSTTGAMDGSQGFTTFYGPALDSVEVVPGGCNGADVATLGGAIGGDGILTVDDIVVFLAAFFGANLSVADVATVGGAIGGDGQLTADDIIVFLSLFFEGCPG